MNKRSRGASLVVLWLRVCVPNAGGPDAIPGQGTRSHMPQRKGPPCCSILCALRPSATKLKKNKCNRDHGLAPVPKRARRIWTSGGRRKEPRWNSITEARPHEACAGNTDRISRGLPVPRDRRLCSVDQSCPTLCNPVNCGPPGSSVPGIFQTRILERVVISFCKGSS